MGDDSTAVPDRQSDPLQDLSYLVRQISGSVASTYQEIQNLKNQSPAQNIIAVPDAQANNNRTFVMIAAIAALLLAWFFIRKKRK